MKKHTSSLDRTSILITAGVAALAVFVINKGYDSYHHSAGDTAKLVYLYITIGLFICLLAGTWLFQTRSISTDNTGITIDRFLKPVTILYSEIKWVMPLTKYDMSLTVRTFGNGGLFGYIGMYYNKAFGSMRWYCTNRNNYLLIEKTNGKKIVISPDDPNELIQTLKVSCPSLQFIYPESLISQ